MANTSPPSFEEIAKTILSMGGSAAGCDGWPYEVFHLGVNFVAHLLAQAFHAAGMSREHLEAVLGPSIDLLLWIPKKANSETPDAQRPLQLPPCLRRLFGACCMIVTGPRVEPHLSQDQAAKKGGTCADNIKRVFAHLLSDGSPPKNTQKKRKTQCLCKNRLNIRGSNMFSAFQSRLERGRNFF